MSVRDQVRYSEAQVETLLPSVWDGGYILHARPAQAAQVAPPGRHGVDPHRVPDWVLGCADVQVGFRRAGLGFAERECLRHVHHLGFTPGQLAGVWDVTSEEVYMACATGVAKITAWLNRLAP